MGKIRSQKKMTSPSTKSSLTYSSIWSALSPLAEAKSKKMLIPKNNHETCGLGIKTLKFGRGTDKKRQSEF